MCFPRVTVSDVFSHTLNVCKCLCRHTSLSLCGDSRCFSRAHNTVFFQGAQYFFRDVVADIYRRVTIYDIVSECTGRRCKTYHESVCCDDVSRVLTVWRYNISFESDEIKGLFRHEGFSVDRYRCVTIHRDINCCATIYRVFPGCDNITYLLRVINCPANE